MPVILLIVLTGSFGSLHAAVEKPVISHPPAGGIYAKNATARFSVSAYSLDNGYLTYQWYCSQGFSTPLGDPNGADKTTVQTGATSLLNGTGATITTTTPNVTGTKYYYYWTEITNNLNHETETIESAIVEVKVVDRELSDKLENGTFRDLLSFDPTKPYQIDGKMPAYWETTAAKSDGWAGKYIQIRTDTKFGYMERPNGSYCAELSGEDYSSLYQDIATVPGKIYEWSLYHANFAKDSEDIMAVIIGPAINEEADYSETKRWSVWTSPEYVSVINNSIGPYIYPYGEHFTSSYFYDITMALVRQEGLNNISNLAGKSGQTFTVNYNNRTYYIYICSSRNTRNQFSGCYSVPVGNGTTVFGFAGIQSNSPTQGNVIADIRFASGSSPASTPTVTYNNDVSISVPTKAGYVYGLAEMRGSSLNLVAGARALYDPDGTGAQSEVSILVDATLGDGAGWYAADNTNKPFTDNGVILFRNLTPGKTYRLVGIPRLAVNPGLRTNLNPISVYDDNYYTNIQTDPAYKGDLTHVWNIDVEEYMDGLDLKARIAVKNARTDVEYALLPDDGTGRPLTTFPGSAPGHTVWRPGTDGFAVFDDLQLNAYYFLVARPYGYSEITHAIAATAADGVTPLYIKMKTPGIVRDIDPVNVTCAGCTSITLANTQASYDYAVVDPENGFIVDKKSGNGNTLTFTVPDNGKTYQIITRNTTNDVNWLKGVRVYRCPDSFTINYTSETVNSLGGNIPVNVEYRIQGNDAGHSWIIPTWTASIGTQPVNLAANILAGNTRSILDSLRMLNADATLSYRIRAGSDGYTGMSVSFARTILIPRRPAAPAAPASYKFDYAAEHITVAANSLLFAQVYTSQWTTVPKNGFWTFAAADWGQGVSRRLFYVRFPATATAFASIVRTDTIPARPPAPDVGIEIISPVAFVTGLKSGTNYQYHVNASSAWTLLDHLSTSSDYRSSSFAFQSAVDTCFVRLAATATRPASFITTLTGQSLLVRDVYFENYTYGETPVDTFVFLRNHDDDTITINSLTLVGDSASHYTLSHSGSSVVLPKGTNTAWRIIPKTGLNAGSHSARIVVTYTYNGTSYTATAGVNLTVDRANRNMTGIRGSFDVSQTQAQRLHLNITGAPPGTILSYYYGMTPVPGNPQSTVNAAGNASFTFTDTSGLQPASIYPVGVVVEGDHNYYATTAVMPIAEGYTAYAAPVFSDVVTINYSTEQLIFNSGYSSADYTFRCSSCSGAPVIANPYRLTGILNSLSDPYFTLSVVRNANSNPPFPASQEGYSANIANRPAAPSIDTVVHVSTATGSDGEIRIAGKQFEYIPYGSSVLWNRVTGTAPRLVTGDYDVRYPATNTTFVSHSRLVTVSCILNPATPIIRQCLSRDTVAVLIPPTLNTVAYQWYACDDLNRTNARPLDSVTADGFPVPDTLVAGIYYYYCVIKIANSSSLTSGVVKVTVSSFPDAVFDPSQPFTVMRSDDNSVTFHARILNRGSGPLGDPQQNVPFYATLYRDTTLAPGSSNPGPFRPGTPATGDPRIAIKDVPAIPPGKTADLDITVPDIRPYLPFTQFVIRLNDRGNGDFPYQTDECDCRDSVRTHLNPFLGLMMTKEATLNGLSNNGTYANPVSVLFKEEITYKITAVNANLRNGGMIIRDTLPPYLHVANAVAASVTSGGGTTANAGNVYTGSLIVGTPRETVSWFIPRVQPRDTVVVSYKATLKSGVSASQPFFISNAWVQVSDTLFVMTNSTYHQGAGVSTVTFSASPGGMIFNAGEQALDYRTSPRTDRLLIVPDSGYAFAGWSHDAYRSLRGELIPADSGIMALDSLIVYGNIEIRADFAPFEAGAPEEKVIGDKDAGDRVWSYGNHLYVQAKTGTSVYVYTTEGVLCRHFVITSEGVTTVRLPRGIYFVALNSRHDGGYKVMIRD